MSEAAYLVSELTGLLATTLLLALGGEERRRMLRAGLWTCLCLPMVPWLEPGYWAPARLLPWPLGPEDALYVIGAGVSAWFFAMRRLRFVPHPGGPAAPRRRMAGLALLCLPAWAGLMGLGLNGSEALLLLLALCVAGLCARRPELAPGLLTAALGHGLWVGALLALRLELWPDLAGLWLPGVWSSRPVLGVPFGEWLYAVLLGAWVPPVAAWLMGGELTPRGAT